MFDRKQGLYLEAVSDYSASLQLQPNNIKSLNNRGYCFAKLAQFQKAVADYSQVLQCCYMCVLVLQYC
jgi:tetratricopeptide (TPR) repeat protein